eukprot:332282-Lingulodinium_polyedra.AAC.1
MAAITGPRTLALGNDFEVRAPSHGAPESWAPLGKAKRATLLMPLEAWRAAQRRELAGPSGLGWATGRHGP